MEPTEPNVSDFHFCHFDRWLQSDGLLCPSLIVTNKQANKQNKNTMSRRQGGRVVRALDLDFFGVAPILDCTQTLFYFSHPSSGKHRRAREWAPTIAWDHALSLLSLFPLEPKKQRSKKIIIITPDLRLYAHHYPYALEVNKSPAVYFLSRALDGLWRENRG